MGAEMLGIIDLIKRIAAGTLSSIILIGIVAALGWSGTISALIENFSAASAFFLIMLAVVLADIIAKVISIISTTFPDLIPKVDNESVKRASLLRRLRPGQTVALLSGANAARLTLFLVIFALLGASYAAAPRAAQETLFGNMTTWEAIDIFVREGIAGSLGYFLFFLGSDNLEGITSHIAEDRLTAFTEDGDVFLSGIRIYGLAFVLAILRTIVIPITFVRARLRARLLDAEDSAA